MDNMESNKISLVIPTFNERENIISLLTALKPFLSNGNNEIIVVDDNSPDFTWKVVEDYSKTNRNIIITRRLNKAGLSTSLIDGFKVSKGGIIGVVDADMSHDITKLPEMIEAVRSGFELAVGSRRVKGGGADNWPIYRKFMSDLATFLTKFFLDVELSDPMSGFFILDRRLYERVKNRLTGRGYKLLVEIYVLGRPRQVKEVPFIFKGRHQGYSKLTLKVIFEFFRMIFELRGSRVKAD